MLSLKQAKKLKKFQNYTIEREDGEYFIRLRNGIRYRCHGQYFDNISPDMNDPKTKKLLG